MAECDLCDGTGDCQNDFHHELAMDPEAIAKMIVDASCPACGTDTMTPGKCSKCGGTGEIDDED